MSNIDLVLLGLIKQKSQSAYDIKKNTWFLLAGLSVSIL